MGSARPSTPSGDGTRSCRFEHRIIVAGGGGGGGNFAGADGDAGGGLTGGGSICENGGESGSQQCGGVSACNVDDAPMGSGQLGCRNTGFGGGGGGWYGGGSGDPRGGGSSGFITGLSLSGSFPGGTNSGNGKVIITTTT